MRRSTQIIIASLAWLAGLALALILPDQVTWLVGVLAVICLVCLIIVKSKLGYIVIGLAFIMLGLLRGQAGLQAEAVSISSLIGDKPVIRGRVLGEPGWNNDHLYEFYLTDLKIDERKIGGILKVKSLTGAILEGQQVELTGKLGRALGRAGAQIWYAKPKLIAYHQAYPIRLKSLLTTGLNKTLPPGMAGFTRGLLFGSRSAVPADLEAAMQRIGLTHIVAVSGYNLTIIVAALSAFIRKQSRIGFIGTLSSIVFFVVMTGAPASIVRAAIMTSLFLVVGRARRDLDPKVALSLSLILMTAWDPTYLYRDLGWQLSVLALAGVLWLSPFFLPRAPVVSTMRQLLAASLGATIATAPILAYTFGSLAVIAPLANLFVLPLIPLAMLLGYLAALIGVLLPTDFSWLVLPANWLMQFLTWLIRSLSQISWSSLKIANFEFSELVISYSLIGIIIWLRSIHRIRPQTLTRPLKPVKLAKQLTPELSSAKTK